MNEPIISPLLIYFIGSLDGICMFFLIVSAICIFFTFASYEDYGEDRWRNSKKFIPIAIITFLLFVFIPGQRTAEKMLIAHYCTPANVQQISDKVETSTTKLIKILLSNKKGETK